MIFSYSGKCFVNDVKGIAGDVKIFWGDAMLFVFDWGGLLTKLFSILMDKVGKKQ